MRGAEIFTADEQAFFGRKFRHALCNVNMSAPGFRHAWFLDRAQFDAGDERRKTMTDREVAKELEGMFVEAYRLAKDARDATGAERGLACRRGGALAHERPPVRVVQTHETTCFL